ncbi:hypothetical protein YC2023_079869 [Brassica napus]
MCPSGKRGSDGRDPYRGRSSCSLVRDSSIDRTCIPSRGPTLCRKKKQRPER